MPREKKDAVPVAIRMDKEIYDKLTVFCADSGQTKAVAIERALAMYVADYNAKQAIIKGEERANG